MKYMQKLKFNNSDKVEILQDIVPKINLKSYRLADCEPDWAPSGSGNLFSVLFRDGKLDNLLDEGYEYAFISSIDNTAAVLCEKIASYFRRSGLDMLMEVCERVPDNEENERGHLCIVDGRFCIRELQDVLPEDLGYFRDVERHPYCDTGNYWVKLHAIKEHQSIIQKLPGRRQRIRGVESIDAVTIETKVGDAIGIMNSGVLLVPRDRCLPTNTVEDLALLRSDAYVFEEYTPRLSHVYALRPKLQLDPQQYRHYDDFCSLFPYGVPSLVDCESLKVVGKIIFGKDVIVRGKVVIINSKTEPVLVTGTLVNNSFTY